MQLWIFCFLQLFFFSERGGLTAHLITSLICAKNAHFRTSIAFLKPFITLGTFTLLSENQNVSSRKAWMLWIMKEKFAILSQLSGISTTKYILKTEHLLKLELYYIWRNMKKKKKNFTYFYFSNNNFELISFHWKLIWNFSCY